MSLPSIAALSGSNKQASTDAMSGDVARSMGAVMTPMPMPAFRPPPSLGAGKGGHDDQEDGEFDCCSSPFSKAGVSVIASGPLHTKVAEQWSIEEEDVETLPERHPLERTSAFVPES